VSRIEFDSFFAAATNHRRFDYQLRLAEGDGQGIGKSLLIDVPTGLGKTAAAVMAWLWNLIESRPCPRRLIYCLPMRTLVEQTRSHVAEWLGNLAKLYPNPELQ
jgi:CRISPR-associated endonuclease/helicase Cas3